MSNIFINRPIVAMIIAILLVISTVAMFCTAVLTALADVLAYIIL